MQICYNDLVVIMVESEESSLSQVAEAVPELSRKERLTELKLDISKQARDYEEAVRSDIQRATRLAGIALHQKSTETPEESSDCIEWPIFRDKIYLNRAPYSGGYVTSPTPLDPDNVEINHIPYRNHATYWMTERLHGTLSRLVEKGFTMSDATHSAIVDEIEAQHGIRCEQNQGAYARLIRAVAKNPERLDIGVARSIEAIRSGKATSLQRINLLSAFPKMFAIEDMKDTAALDDAGYEEHVTDYVDSLRRLSQEDVSNKTLFVEREDGKKLYRCVDERGIYVGKSVLGYLIIDGDLILDVIERRSYAAFGAGQGLPGATGQTLELEDGTSIDNAYIVGGSVYLRTQNAGISSDPEDMEELLFIN